MSAGERIAEKLRDWVFVNLKSSLLYSDKLEIAALIDQELLAASQRNTDTTDSKSHRERGDLIEGIENALKAVERETNGLGDPYDNPEIEVMRQASLRMFESIEKPLRFALALHAQRVKLVSSHEPKSTVEGEKEKPVWIRTAERAPDEKDGDNQGYVFTRNEIGGCIVSWGSIRRFPHVYTVWMKIPALPEGEKDL